MNTSVIFLLIAIVIVGILVFVGISIIQKRQRALDRTAYQGRWLAIENSLDEKNSATYKLAILEADKLLDRALRELGIRGSTLGERLKHSGSSFSQLNDVWAAHKLRNQIAHEMDINVSYAQTQKTLKSFRQALKDLGAI